MNANRRLNLPPLSSVRFPRSMAPSPEHLRLLESLGVELIDDCDAELADVARAWLATARPGNAESAAAIRRVREALARHDHKMKEAAA